MALEHDPALGLAHDLGGRRDFLSPRSAHSPVRSPFVSIDSRVNPINSSVLIFTPNSVRMSFNETGQIPGGRVGAFDAAIVDIAADQVGTPSRARALSCPHLQASCGALLYIALRCLFITSSYSSRCLRISKFWVSTAFWGGGDAFVDEVSIRSEHPLPCRGAASCSACARRRRCAADHPAARGRNANCRGRPGVRRGREAGCRCGANRGAPCRRCADHPNATTSSCSFCVCSLNWLRTRSHSALAFRKLDHIVDVLALLAQLFRAPSLRHCRPAKYRYRVPAMLVETVDRAFATGLRDDLRLALVVSWHSGTSCLMPIFFNSPDSCSDFSTEMVPTRTGCPA